MCSWGILTVPRFLPRFLLCADVGWGESVRVHWCSGNSVWLKLPNIKQLGLALQHYLEHGFSVLGQLSLGSMREHKEEAKGENEM